MAHRYYGDEGITDVFLIDGYPNVVTLLVVNEHTPAAGIMPIRFGRGAACGRFPVSIVEITPDEFLKLQRKELELPHGWKLGKRVERPAESDDLRELRQAACRDLA